MNQEEQGFVTLYETDPNTGHAKPRKVRWKVGAELPAVLKTLESLENQPNSGYHHPPVGTVIIMHLVKGGRNIFHWENEQELCELFLAGDIVVFDDQQNEIGDKNKRGHRSEKTGHVVQINLAVPREVLGRFLEL
jgi:hypothetical protein